MQDTLRAARMAASKNQSDMAKPAGMSVHAYSKKERGLRKISTREARIFASVLSKTIDELFPEDKCGEE